MPINNASLLEGAFTLGTTAGKASSSVSCFGWRHSGEFGRSGEVKVDVDVEVNALMGMPDAQDIYACCFDVAYCIVQRGSATSV
jgi:hypothetical protein